MHGGGAGRATDCLAGSGPVRRCWWCTPLRRPEQCRHEIVAGTPGGVPARRNLLRNDVAIRSLRDSIRRSNGSTARCPRSRVREGPCAGCRPVERSKDWGLSRSTREPRSSRNWFAGWHRTRLFRYHGSSPCISPPAAVVTALDVSESALQRGAEHAALNGLDISASCGDAFDQLAEWHREGRTFDLVVCRSSCLCQGQASWRRPARYHESTRAMPLLARWPPAHASCLVMFACRHPDSSRRRRHQPPPTHPRACPASPGSSEVLTIPETAI